MRRFFSTDNTVYLLLIATAILWGANAVTAKFTVDEISPLVTIFIRFTCMSVILIIMVLKRDGIKAIPTVKQLPWLIALGVTGFFLNNYFFFTGVKYSTAANASLLAAANPVITAAITGLFMHERLMTNQLIGIVLSFCGVAVVVTKGSWANLTSLTFNHGDLLLALAPVFWSIYSIIGRSAMRHISALAATAWSSLIGAALLFIASIVEGFDGHVGLSTSGWANMLYMILGSGVLAFYWWNKGVAIIGPNRAAIFTNLIPLAGMFFAALFLHETITWSQLTGAMMIISGVYLTTHSPVKVSEVIDKET